jgi:hypothetical protein
LRREPSRINGVLYAKTMPQYNAPRKKMMPNINDA